MWHYGRRWQKMLVILPVTFPLTELTISEEDSGKQGLPDSLAADTLDNHPSCSNCEVRSPFALLSKSVLDASSLAQPCTGCKCIWGRSVGNRMISNGARKFDFLMIQATYLSSSQRVSHLCSYKEEELKTLMSKAQMTTFLITTLVWPPCIPNQSCLVLVTHCHLLPSEQEWHLHNDTKPCNSEMMWQVQRTARKFSHPSRASHLLVCLPAWHMGQI